MRYNRGSEKRYAFLPEGNRCKSNLFKNKTLPRGMGRQRETGMELYEIIARTVNMG